MFYTVILEYPDYLCEGGTETYTSSVEARSPKDAVQAVREEIAESVAESDEMEGLDPYDWACIACFAGQHSMLDEEDGQPAETDTSTPLTVVVDMTGGALHAVYCDDTPLKLRLAFIDRDPDEGADDCERVALEVSDTDTRQRMTQILVREAMVAPGIVASVTQHLGGEAAENTART